MKRGRPATTSKKGWHHISTAPRDGTFIWCIEPTSCGVFKAHYSTCCFWVWEAHDLWPSHPSHWQPYVAERKPEHPGDEFFNLPYIKQPWLSNIDEPEHILKNHCDALEMIWRLESALEKTQIGVNHIATYRTDKWPDYGTPHDAALEALGAGREYDMWCCWNATMTARDELEARG